MTAREIVEKNSYLPDLDWKHEVVTDEAVIKLMIEFAKFHVQEALKEVDKTAFVKFTSGGEDFDYDDVLGDEGIDYRICHKGYLLENIK